jgi:hypothetical protein
MLLACLCETVRYAREEAHRIEEISALICNIFKTGVLIIHHGSASPLIIAVANSIRTSSSFSLFEINWFIKTAFNLAGVFYKKSCYQRVIQLLSYVSEVGNIEPGSSTQLTSFGYPFLQPLARRSRAMIGDWLKKSNIVKQPPCLPLPFYTPQKPNWQSQLRLEYVRSLAS